MNSQVTPQTLARQLGLGKLLYRLYYGPRGAFEQLMKRGYIPHLVDQWNKSQMEAMADRLPCCAERPGPFYDVHFLTGKKFWQQTCFCFYSLWQQTSLNLRLIIHDDGSLTPTCQASIQRIFPTAQIISAQDIQRRLDQYLPESDYPCLRARRIEYPHLRKLTDIHVGQQGWKLVLDSDMLFFNPPTELLEWLRSPQSPSYMVDVQTSYGYSADLMTELAGVPIPEKVNVGISGLNSSQLDWPEIEAWCRTMIEREGTHYCQEQALIAMIMARQSCAVMPADTYIVMPQRGDVVQPTAKLHHYVADSKPWYFRHGWRHVIADPS
ncbi:MAG: glycosyl transferase [Cyanobacteria bacterium P01_F01_bin.42]